MASQSDKIDGNNDELKPEPNAEIEAEESAHRQTMRQREWGQQYDMWLIRAARRKQGVELLLAIQYPGVTRDNNIVACIPLRIDRYMIEVSVDGVPIWLNKMWIIGTKPIGKIKTEAGDSSE